MISLSLLLLLLALLPSLPLLGAGVSSSTLLSPSLQFGDHLCYVKHHVFTWRDKHRVLFSLQPHVGRMNPVRSQTQQDEPCQESDSAGWTLSGIRLSCTDSDDGFDITKTNLCVFCVWLTGGEFVLTQAAVSLLHLDSDSTSELDVSVPLPGVHLVLQWCHSDVILTPTEVCVCDISVCVSLTST